MAPAYELIAREAFSKLFPEKVDDYIFSVKYSGQFTGYNGNIRMRGNHIVVKMSKQWRGVSKEIQMGLIHELLIRLFKKKMHTMEMDLYHMFLKKVHIAIPKDKTDPILDTAFEKVNNTYFNGVIEKPNLAWGGDSTARLGTYTFGTDTIVISRILHPENCKEQELMEYVLYHEVLHKKFKFSSHAGHTRTHTREFREWESKFANSSLLEKRLGSLAVRKKIVKMMKPRTLFGIRWP